MVSIREQLVELGISEFQFAESLNVLGNLRDDLPLEGQENNSTSHFIDPVTLRQIFCDIGIGCFIYESLDSGEQLLVTLY